MDQEPTPYDHAPAPIFRGPLPPLQSYILPEGGHGLIQKISVDQQAAVMPDQRTGKEDPDLQTPQPRNYLQGIAGSPPLPHTCATCHNVGEPPGRAALRTHQPSPANRPHPPAATSPTADSGGRPSPSHSSSTAPRTGTPTRRIGARGATAMPSETGPRATHKRRTRLRVLTGTETKAATTTTYRTLRPTTTRHARPTTSI